MHLFDIVVVLLCSLLVGNELAVSLFLNPAIWKLNDGRAAAELARSLGRFMPPWYALCLILLGTEAWLHRHSSGHLTLLPAAVLWALAIICTLVFLVPRNNRVAAGAADWLKVHHQWDTLHRCRILVLTLAVLLLLHALLA